MSANVDRALIALLCLVSLLMPLIQHVMRTRNEGNPVVREASVRWLALPVGMELLREPVSRWRFLESSESDHSMVRSAEASAILPDETSQPENNDPLLRFQLFGVVREGNDPVYCFLDTEKQSWFRLQPGERDASSKAELLMDQMDGHLYLRDHINGRQFRVESDNWALSPVDPEELQTGGPLP